MVPRQIFTQLAGVADCTVLNRDAILGALSKQTPRKPVEIGKNELYGRCAVAEILSMSDIGIATNVDRLWNGRNDNGSSDFSAGTSESTV